MVRTWTGASRQLANYTSGTPITTLIWSFFWLADANVHVLFLQRLSKRARTNYMRAETSFGLTEPAESLRVPSGCYLSLGYSRSRSICPKHTVGQGSAVKALFCILSV